MRNGLLTAGCLLLVVGLSGCNSPDRLMAKQISLMNELAEAMEKGESEDDLKEIGERLEANGKKIKDLDLSQEEMMELMKDHREDFTKAAARLMSASMSKAFKGMGKDMGANFPGFGS